MSGPRNRINVCGFDYDVERDPFGGNLVKDLSGNIVGGDIPNHGLFDVEEGDESYQDPDCEEEYL